jgi:hypothetical protein
MKWLQLVAVVTVGTQLLNALLPFGQMKEHPGDHPQSKRE